MTRLSLDQEIRETKKSLIAQLVIEYRLDPEITLKDARRNIWRELRIAWENMDLKDFSEKRSFTSETMNQMGFYAFEDYKVKCSIPEEYL